MNTLLGLTGRCQSEEYSDEDVPNLHGKVSSLRYFML